MHRNVTELTTDLLRAETRLALIARMAKLNLEQRPDQQDFDEVLQTILATCSSTPGHHTFPGRA